CASSLLLLAAVSCASHRSFQVIPAAPDYLLRDPAKQETAFPETLRAYNGYTAGGGWMDLHPGMELRIENAYYEPGASRRGLKGYLGTEVARYKVPGGGGLQLVSVQPMKNRPAGDPPVEALIPLGQQRRRYLRFY